MNDQQPQIVVQQTVVNKGCFSGCGTLILAFFVLVWVTGLLEKCSG